MTKKAVKKKAAPKRGAKKRACKKKAVRKDKGGRPSDYPDDKTKAEAERRQANERQRRINSAGRDIAPLPIAAINWQRRTECERNLRKFAETYLPGIFYYGWSDDQLKCVRKVEMVFLEGGMFALAMPRGGGKTAICRAGMIWGTAYGHRKFPYFVGSTAEKAIQTLSAIKTLWYRSPELRQDFPEIAYPIHRLENRYQLARGQTYNGNPTHIEWGNDTVRYPCIIMPRDEADYYIKNLKKNGTDPDKFLKYYKAYDGYVTITAGIYIGTAGIDGSIRGEADTHPITLEQPRPDLVLLDDIQKDQKAESPAACDKLIRLVEGAISGLAGPGQHIAALMPCTVIREDDVADTFLDPLRKPEWLGERCSMVTSWPEGISDFEITLDSPAGRLWNEYSELRKKSLKLYEDARLATEFYRENQAVMDDGFSVSWKDRYTKDGRHAEVSAQQHAMNLRLKAPDSFPSEFQNRGRRLYEEGEVMITPGQLAEKVLPVKPGSVPDYCDKLVTFIDVQNEILYWLVYGFGPDFSGVFTQYGTWPPVGTRYFTKNQTEGWSLITREFFKRYPEHKEKAIRTQKGKVRAPLEAKIYFALGECLAYLDRLEFIREDGHQTPMKYDKLAIDTRWGQASDAIKRFIKDQRRPQLMPYFGQPVPPTHRQFEEYSREQGWLFEDQVNPSAKEVRWAIKPNKVGQYYILADVNRLKDMLFARLGSPLGSSGSIALFDESPERHEMFAQHVCGSEYPEPVSARGMTKNQWQLRENRPDNDWLDCAVGCLCLASICGASVQTSKDAKPKSGGRGRKISDRWKKRRA